MKKHLITLSYNTHKAFNHGLVDIDESGLVNGETPIEDFGMFFYRDEPFPADEGEICGIFIELMEDDAFGFDDTVDGKTVREWLKTDKQHLKDKIYYGTADFKKEVELKIWEA